MAVKKTELYSSLWASCDALRGGMDASQYKDYILTLLFMKYVTDKYKGQKYGDLIVFDKANDPNPDPEKRTGCSFDDFIALKNKKNIGEGIDKIIARLAEVNEGLKGVIDIAHFNDETKIGKNKEMVDKLTKLISIFQRPELDFSKNKAEGDDIIGDAYEYLMRNFASESGKSKGQFYTPAEVSRILAKIIGIDKCSDHDATVCDPACGSGSLLIRALEEAPFEISGYGQEKDSSTAGLAKMNAVLHNKATIKIMAGNTFSDPQFKKAEDASELERFDYIVANPPFSLKNWADGLKEFGRFSGYGDRPPEKNGDYAWLMHILKTLKSTGKAAVILPHGVMMGYKPVEDGFELKYGIFYRFCQKAANHPDKDYFFIIDEINRGNMSKIFGELLMLIEADYRETKTTLAYNGLSFSVPKRLHIIGMMNTADRSLAMIDYALRRRFSFFDMEPGFDSEGFIKYQEAFTNDTFNTLIDRIKELNREIANDKSLGKGFCIGHSYFCNTKECTDEWMQDVVDFDILPMLAEYWFDDTDKLQRWENILHGVFQ